MYRLFNKFECLYIDGPLYDFNIAELEKKLAELQKYVKNEGENPPEWLSLESEAIKSPKVEFQYIMN